MAKPNKVKCKEWRDSQPKVLRVPMPEATRQALNEIMAWHSYTDGREAVAKFIHRLHALGREATAELFAVERHAYSKTEEELDQVDWR